MQVECLQCRARLLVPDSQADNPRVKLKCPACQFVFPVVSAQRVQPTAPVTAGPMSGAPVAPAGAAPPGGAPLSGPPAPTPPPAPPAAHMAPVAPTAPSAPPHPGPASPPGVATVPTSYPSGRRGKKAWKYCVNHAQAWSEKVCPICKLGYCLECGTKVHMAVICPACETLCIRPDQLEAKLAREVRRRTPLLEEIQVVLQYPFSDLWTLIPLTAIYLLFSFGQALAIFPTNWFAAVFANGILMAYTFHAVLRVSSGNLKLSMPEIRDFGDILDTAVVALAAWLISWGPLMILSAAAGFSLVTAMATALTTGGGALGSTLAAALLKMGVGLAWLVGYSPAAVTVAAISKSFFATINPVNGVTSILRMGETYWQAAMVFMGFQLTQFLVCTPFANMMFAGNFVYALTNVYMWTATGCLIGLTIDKTAEELGLE